MVNNQYYNKNLYKLIKSVDIELYKNLCKFIEYPQKISLFQLSFLYTIL